MFEIELKAWLTEPSETEKTVLTFTEYLGLTEKDDTYWEQSNIQPLSTEINHHPTKVRIRQETNHPIIVNYKQKEIRTDGIEINNEQEFSLEDKEARLVFENILNASGFVIAIQKHKTTKSFIYKENGFNILIEISNVKDLGDFIEIEILSETNDKETTDKAHKQLLLTLAKCNVSEDKIESRYYSDLLKNHYKHTT